MPRYLVAQSGSNLGSAIQLMGEIITIGRSPDNDILIDHPLVSRHHARLDLRARTYILTDLDSTNGTWVNQRRVDAPTPLRVGDWIAFGSGLVFVFSTCPSSDTEETYEL